MVLESFIIIVSIGTFNACGVFVTKFASASQRSTIDTSRTLLIWIFSVAVGWEDFIPLELLGFFFLVLGTLVYNEIVVLPFACMKNNTKDEIHRKTVLESLGNDESTFDDDRNQLVKKHNHSNQAPDSSNNSEARNSLK